MYQKYSPIKKDNYVCDCCDYMCSKKNDYTKHLTSAIHKGNVSKQETIGGIVTETDINSYV
jgi:hypothetical protein